jgi:hypothetical protein
MKTSTLKFSRRKLKSQESKGKKAISARGINSRRKPSSKTS